MWCLNKNLITALAVSWFITSLAEGFPFTWQCLQVILQRLPVLTCRVSGRLLRGQSRSCLARRFFRTTPFVTLMIRFSSSLAWHNEIFLFNYLLNRRPVLIHGLFHKLIVKKDGILLRLNSKVYGCGIIEIFDDFIGIDFLVKYP